MARCPDCNKFVSVEPEQFPEVTTEIVDEQPNGDIRMVLNCAECGTELLSCDDVFDVSLDHQYGLHSCEPDIDDENTEVMDTTVKGKRVIVCDYSAVVKYSCGHIEPISARIEQPISNFEEV